MTLDKLYEQIKSWRDIMQHEGMTTTAYEMEQALKSIESDMRLTEAKKAGNASIVKAANRIIKNAESGVRDILKGMFENKLDGGTVYCVCDGYRAVRFKNKMLLPEIDEKYKGTEFNLTNVCKPSLNAREIQLPDIADVKVWAKTQKYVEGKKKYIKPYLLNEKIGVYVNPNYLIDMMECLPNAKVYAASPVSAIYFKADNGDGVLLPCRKK